MRTFITYTLVLFSLLASAQKKDTHLADGNKEFSGKNYKEAEAEYRLSQNAAPKKVAATFNLGNTIYTLNLPEEAGFVYQKAVREAKTYTEKHKAYHNLGNVFMKMKNYEAAVDAYKQALVNDPTDEETRYNYALARLYKKNNPQKGGGKDPNKKDGDDKQKQPKPQPDKKDGDGDNKDQQKKPGDKDKGQPKDKGEQPQPRPQGASKQRIESILNAINNEEKKVQDKMKEKAKSQPVQPEKDW